MPAPARRPRAPPTQVREHPALHAAQVVGGVLRLRAQRGAVEHEGGVGVEEDEVGRGAGREAAGGEAEQARRVERERPPERRQRQVAGVVELHRGRQQRLEADGAARGLLEGQALLLLVLRRVERADDVDQARRPAPRPCAMRSSSERSGGRELEEGAVVADVELVERQVVDRGAGGDRRGPAAGRGASAGRRGGGRDLVGVVAGAGRLDEREVALEPDALGDRRDRRAGRAAQANWPGGHAGALGERRVLRVADDQRAEAGGVGQAALEDAGVGDGARRR